MKLKIFRNFLFLLFAFPIILEIINSKTFLVLIPGSPFTLGRLLFILIGILGLVKIIKNNNSFSSMSIALLLIFFGQIIGSFFSENIYLSLSRAFGNLILTISAIGFGNYTIKDKKFFFDALFIANLSYWIWYLFTNMFLGMGSGLSYGNLFSNEAVFNHHIVGMNITTSVVYLSNRFFASRNKVLFLLLYFIGILCSLYIESRSNSLALIILLIINLYIYDKKNKTNLIITTSIVVFFVILVVNTFLLTNDAIATRFDFNDKDYIESTTSSRRQVYFIIPQLIFDNFFGRGPIDIMVEISPGQKMLAHNSYLTFLISGGILSFFGIVLLFKSFLGLWRKMGLVISEIDKYKIALVLSSLLFLITIFTIEYLGLVFFIFISIITNIDKNLLNLPSKEYAVK
jgi:hypothetical protein